MQLTPGDLKRLYNAHPDLVLVILAAARVTTVPFTILETTRSIEQQKINIKKGVSWTMRSRHLPSADGLSRAADVAPLGPDGKGSYAWPLYHQLAPQIKDAAKRVGVNVEWGGDWKKTPDGPHWQLPWKEYP
jgi:peptidoglycan L-alanyl-D-glutamate endopeptidase CwlK